LFFLSAYCAADGIFFCFSGRWANRQESGPGGLAGMSEGIKIRATDDKLVDYKAHYQADAEAIVDPEELTPLRRTSEYRRLAALVRLLRLQPGEKLLDSGCGSGWLAALARAAGARVWAMDIAPAGVVAARARFPEAGFFQVGDGYHLPFAAASFDTLVLSEVVEHLEDIEAAFAEVRRVLRPGGRVLVSVPYRETILQHLCIHCNQFTPANAHLHRFDEKKLANYLESQRLAVQQVLLLTNKLLELVGFPRWSRRWPYCCWRGFDWLFNKLTGKPAFLCVLATRTG